MSAVERPPVPASLERGYLTKDLPIEGDVRASPEDFEVDEVPIYEPSGQGEHLYLRIEKRGISTDEAIRRLARRLSMKRRAIGYAGLKDARAVTRQTISVHVGREEPDTAKLEDEQMRVLSAKRHKNKIKIGHLQGNRFRLRLRGGGEHLETARSVLTKLAATGVANYYGLQRFGRERTTHRLGQALVAEDPDAFCELLLLGARRSKGEPPPAWTPSGKVSRAREAVEAGDYEAAARQLPASLTAERAVCQSLARGNPALSAVKAVSQKQRIFYVAAFQSWLFNAYLTRRLDRVTRVETGEVVTLHRNGAAFVVEDLAAEQPRCDAFEISPSGPCFGRRLLRPHEGSTALADEQTVLAELAPGLTAELTPALGAKPRGQRRPLRIPLADPSVEPDGDDLSVRFFLPKGCYATSVLEELFKRQTD